jgi:phage shock protein C
MWGCFMNKRLYLSRSDVKISGVCGGIAEYFNIDPTIVRLVWVIGSLILGAGFGGIIAYIICAIVIPKNPGLF